MSHKFLGAQMLIINVMLFKAENNRKAYVFKPIFIDSYITIPSDSTTATRI